MSSSSERSVISIGPFMCVWMCNLLAVYIAKRLDNSISLQFNWGGKNVYVHSIFFRINSSGALCVCLMHNVQRFDCNVSLSGENCLHKREPPQCIYYYAFTLCNVPIDMFRASHYDWNILYH